MINNISISIYLDTRRVKANGKFPVKLRVFLKHPRTQKFYPTKYELTEQEFNTILTGKRLNDDQKEIKADLKGLENKAYKFSSSVNTFSFEEFESTLFSNSGELDDVFSIYERIINKLQALDKVSSAESYSLSLTSIKRFLEHKYHKTPITFSFRQITPDLLKLYEKYMLSKNKSLTTIAIYLRCLRAVFNYAIDNKIIDKDFYPFGKKKYQVPAPKGVKKALSKDQLGLLFHAIPATPEQARAKDFFFFSYACNGINFKDIANLVFRNYNGETITFYRAKTAGTNRDQAAVNIYLNEFSKAVIAKYGNKRNSPDDYIFNIVDHSQSAIEQRKQLKNFIRLINQHFSNFAKANGINENVSTYTARHSFATNAIRSGASIEFVSEALSHSNIKTTQEYFAGFENEVKRDISNKLMEF